MTDEQTGILRRARRLRLLQRLKPRPNRTMRKYVPAETTGSQSSTQKVGEPPAVLRATPSLGPSTRANPRLRADLERHVAFGQHTPPGGVARSDASCDPDLVVPLPCETRRAAGGQREAASEPDKHVCRERPVQVELEGPAEIGPKEVVPSSGMSARNGTIAWVNGQQHRSRLGDLGARR